MGVFLAWFRQTLERAAAYADQHRTVAHNDSSCKTLVQRERIAMMERRRCPRFMLSGPQGARWAFWANFFVNSVQISGLMRDRSRILSRDESSRGQHGSREKTTCSHPGSS